MKDDAALGLFACAPGCLEKSLTDVCLLAGLLIDKFCCHLLLYRRHWRLAQAGITLSRGIRQEELYAR